jgi:ABC-2 type transport system permease protein
VTVKAELLAESVRERHRSIGWWMLGIAALIAINIAFYPSIKDSSGLADYSKQLPDTLRALFAGGETDLVSPVGYLNSQIFALMGPMVLLIFTIVAGSGVLAGEEEKGTLDLLLAQPLSRTSLVLQQFGALAAMVAMLGAGLLATTWVGCLIVDLDIAFGALLDATVAVALLSLLFGTLALAVGAMVPGRGRAAALAGGLAVASWILDGLGRAVDSLGPWRPLSPYYQAIGTNPLANGAPGWRWLLIAALTLALLGLAVAGLRRRDVRQ